MAMIASTGLHAPIVHKQCVPVHGTLEHGFLVKMREANKYPWPASQLALPNEETKSDHNFQAAGRSSFST